MSILRLTTITLSLTLLAACGGGGGGATPTTGLERLPAPLISANQVDEVRSIVGGMAPMDDGPDLSEIESRLSDIVEASDALLFNEIANGEIASGETINASRMITCIPGEPTCSAVIEDGMCMRENCMQIYPIEEVDGPILFVGGDGLTGYNDRYSIVMTTNAMIPLVQAQAAARIEGERLEYQSYGGWMENSVFIIEYQNATIGDRMLSRIASYSFGDAIGTNPTTDVTWLGVMVGITKNDDTDIVQGTARINFTIDNSNLNINFRDIKNLNSGADIDNLNWGPQNIMGGTFEADTDTGMIKGNFYGANHEEAGGIFETDDLIGAFGAKR